MVVLGAYTRVVVPIVCHDQPASDLAHISLWRDPARATKDVMVRLRKGLRLLGEHYGIITAALTSAEAMDREKAWRAHEYRLLDHERGLQIKAATGAMKSAPISDPDGAYVGAASGFARVDTFFRKVEKGDRYEPDDDDDDDDDNGELDLGFGSDGFMSNNAYGDLIDIADAQDDEREDAGRESINPLIPFEAEQRKQPTVLRLK